MRRGPPIAKYSDTNDSDSDSYGGDGKLINVRSEHNQNMTFNSSTPRGGEGRFNTGLENKQRMVPRTPRDESSEEDQRYGYKVQRSSNRYRFKPRPTIPGAETSTDDDDNDNVNDDDNDNDEDDDNEYTDNRQIQDSIEQLQRIQLNEERYRQYYDSEDDENMNNASDDTDKNSFDEGRDVLDSADSDACAMQERFMRYQHYEGQKASSSKARLHPDYNDNDDDDDDTYVFEGEDVRKDEEWDDEEDYETLEEDSNDD